MWSSTSSIFRWLRNGSSPLPIGRNQRTLPPASRSVSQNSSARDHEPHASTRTMTSMPLCAAFVRCARNSLPVSSSAKMYISSAMQEPARPMALNIAGKASLPFLRSRTVVIERDNSIQHAACKLQNDRAYKLLLHFHFYLLPSRSHY